MKASIRHKLETVRDRFEELAALLADPDVISEPSRFRDLSREYSRIEPVVELFRQYQVLGDDIGAAEEMTADADEALRKMGQEELDSLTARREQLLLELQKSLIPADRTTTVTCIWRFAPVPAVTKPPFSPATCFACIRNMPRPWVGRSRY